MGRFSRTIPEAKFQFNPPAMKSNIHKMSFMVGQIFLFPLDFKSY